MSNSVKNKDLAVFYTVETQTGKIPNNVGFSTVNGLTRRIKPKKLYIPKSDKLRDQKYN